MAILRIHQGEKTILQEFAPPKLLDDILAAAGVQQPHPCGGRGVCGKCAVKLLGAVSEKTEMERKAGHRLSCQAMLLGDGEVTLLEKSGLAQIQIEGQGTVQAAAPMEGRIGAAVDIGTTTIALRRYDLKTGKLLGQSAMENPQVSVAADVMGRIGAAMDGKLQQLQQQVLSAIETLCVQAGGPADTMVITGNTTMLYLLTGRDTACLSCLPFEADTLFDVQTKILGTRVYLPPCMNAFVGADITCAVLSSGLCTGQTALLCDVGTNGELALWKDGVLYVTSTAAGPAFEGAGISCGCSSVPGAIDRVWAENGKLQIHTIGEVEALGLCGSGLIDTVAQLLDLEWMDETGALEEEDVPLAPGVTLLQKDIRSMQLAKAAIAAGIETLLEVSGTDCSEITKLYLAGGFGSHLNIQNAARIGLFPAELTDKVQVVGNAALAGAEQLLLDSTRLEELRQIAARSRHWNLGGDPRFNGHYMEKMLFPWEE